MLILASLTAGLPVLLITATEALLPRGLPSLSQWQTALLGRDDGSLAVAVILVLGWLAWAALSAAVAAEVVAALRGRLAPTLPGLHLPQVLAGRLVNTALLLFVAPLTLTLAMPAVAAPSSGPGDPSGSAGAPSTAAAPEATDTDVREPVITDRASSSDQQRSQARHVVRRGESLWSIAVDHLGSGLRYTEIAELNAALLQGHPGFLTPGQILRLPQPEEAGRRPGHKTVVVERGDTLSGIAADRLGDPDRYPEIFDASTRTPQADGRRLVDPDVIDVGWVLTVPRPGDHDADGDARRSASPGDSSGRREQERHGQAEPNDPPPRSSPLPAPRTLPTTQPPTEQPPTEQPPTLQPRSADRSAEESTHQEVHDGTSLPRWALTGLSGAGVLLAASSLALLRQRRASQFRSRRPGRAIAVAPASVVPVEKTLVVSGEPHLPAVRSLDDILRRLASARAREQESMPEVQTVELSDQVIRLNLATPCALAPPWEDQGHRRTWQLLRAAAEEVGPAVPDQPAPYPLLVTAGAHDDGRIVLLNCEQEGILTVTGDPAYTGDFIRYLAAEIACNPWSEHARLDGLHVVDDAARMNADRVHSHSVAQLAEVVADAIDDADGLISRSAAVGADVVTARSHLADRDLWPARLLVLPSDTDSLIRPLQRLIAAEPGRTGTAILITGSGIATERPGLRIELTSAGRAVLPDLRFDLVAVGLTPDEAAGCAALLQQAVSDEDAPIPDAGDTGWQALSDAAGALRLAHTQPRGAQSTEPAAAVLDKGDEVYLNAAATTAEDLATLAPLVPQPVREMVQAGDPDLDADLDAWHSADCDLPRLTLLGPVWARTHGAPLTKRRPFYTELLAYLATRAHGATPEETAEAMGVTPARIRTDIKILRDWLGVNPRTGQRHLPDARTSESARTRGISTYQVDGLLVDADLFRRLRLRGTTRGPSGLSDYRAALALVTGRPLDQLRPGGWTWMLDGDRLDQHLLCAVVDVAHLVATAALEADDLAVARAAAEVAIMAAPYEEIPILDLAAVAGAQGRSEEQQRLLIERVYNRSDDGSAPVELPARTATVLSRAGRLDQRAS